MLGPGFIPRGRCQALEFESPALRSTSVYSPFHPDGSIFWCDIPHIRPRCSVASSVIPQVCVGEARWVSARQRAFSFSTGAQDYKPVRLDHYSPNPTPSPPPGGVLFALSRLPQYTLCQVHNHLPLCSVLLRLEGNSFFTVPDAL